MKYLVFLEVTAKNYTLPPYELMDETYDDVTRIQISNGVNILLKDDGKCKGLNFVITGKVRSFTNRDEFSEYVESQGGHVSKSVQAIRINWLTTILSLYNKK